jgi:hypothetical protein
MSDPNEATTPRTIEATGSTVSSEPIADAATQTLDELRVEDPGTGTPPPGGAGGPQFSREEMEEVAGGLCELLRYLLAPKRSAWEIKDSELVAFKKLGAIVIEKHLPAEVAPYTAELALGCVVIAYVTRAMKDDAEQLAREAQARRDAAKPPSS